MFPLLFVYLCVYLQSIRGIPLGERAGQEFPGYDLALMPLSKLDTKFGFLGNKLVTGNIPPQLNQSPNRVSLQY